MMMMIDKDTDAGLSISISHSTRLLLAKELMAVRSKGLSLS